MSDIAIGTSHTAISRAADVVLKEQRRLVLMLRETHFAEQHNRRRNGTHAQKPVARYGGL